MATNHEYRRDCDESQRNTQLIPSAHTGSSADKRSRRSLRAFTETFDLTDELARRQSRTQMRRHFAGRCWASGRSLRPSVTGSTQKLRALPALAVRDYCSATCCRPRAAFWSSRRRCSCRRSSSPKPRCLLLALDSRRRARVGRHGAGGGDRSDPRRSVLVAHSCDRHRRDHPFYQSAAAPIGLRRPDCAGCVANP
jgi:hypothetical protein